jgi:hypothetical protein
VWSFRFKESAGEVSQSLGYLEEKF